MNVINKFKKLMLVILDEDHSEKLEENQYFRSLFAKFILNEENPYKKIKDMELTINRLSDKMSIFTNKISEFEKRIELLTSLQEEVLNMFDQSVNDEEYEHDDDISNSFSEKKYGTN